MIKLITVYLLLIPISVYAQFSSNTVKQIDEIKNNNATSITINPVNNVLMPYLTNGELLYYDSGISSLGNGTENQVLSITGGVLTWIDPPVTLPDQSGNAGKYLQTDGTNASWEDVVSSPITTEGDISIGDVSGNPVRLPIGLVDQILISNGATLTYQDLPISVPTTLKGEISGHNGTIPVAIPAASSDGQFLVSDFTEASGNKWSNTLSGAFNPVTDWESYTPVITGFGTVANNSIEYRRVGDTLELRGRFTAGTVTGTIGAISLPSGLSVRDDGTSLTQPVGLFFRLATSTNKGGTVLALEGASEINFSSANTIGSLSVNPNLAVSASSVVSTGQNLSLQAYIPIQGWSSGIDAISQFKTPIHVEYTRPTLQTIANTGSTTVIFNNEIDDNSGGAYNSSTGVFTAPRDAVYQVCARTLYDTTSWNLASVYEARLIASTSEIYPLTRDNIFTTTSSYYNSGGCAPVKLLTGQTVEYELAQTSSSSRDLIASGNFNKIVIDELPPENVIASAIDSQKWDCEENILSSSFTGTGTISDLTATVEIGKKYRYDIKLWSAGTTGATTNKQWEGEVIHNGVDLIKLNSRMEGIGSYRDILSGYRYFTASATSVTVVAGVVDNTQIFGAANGSASLVTVCKLPDNYIIP